eukprot:352550-Chlamydomonas_euryale.AAC.2
MLGSGTMRLGPRLWPGHWPELHCFLPLELERLPLYCAHATEAGKSIRIFAKGQWGRDNRAYPG